MINLICIAPESTVKALQTKLADGSLTPEQQKAVARRVSVVYRQPTINNEVHTAYDILVDSQEQIDSMAGFDWTLIGMWDFDTGELLSEFNESLYLEIMPDEIKTDDEGNVISQDRPTKAREIHQRAGQAERVFP